MHLRLESYIKTPKLKGGSKNLVIVNRKDEFNKAVLKLTSN